jgi:membrane-associated phospholipid phosphatase
VVPGTAMNAPVAPSRALMLLLLLTWPLQPVDDAVREWVLAHRTSGLRQSMQVVSDRSRLVLFSGVGIALVSGAAGRAFALETAIALLPVNAAVQVLKWTVWRARPDGDRHRANSSFPSSHAANAFTVALVLIRRWRRSVIPASLAALTVAYSRMALDRHWFSDILGALLLAAAGARFAAWALERWRMRKSVARTS